MDHAGTLMQGNDRFQAIILWPPDATMAATNKCLAQSNKPRTGGKATIRIEARTVRMTSGARLTACWKRWRHDRQPLHQCQGLDLQRQRDNFLPVLGARQRALSRLD